MYSGASQSDTKREPNIKFQFIQVSRFWAAFLVFFGHLLIFSEQKVPVPKLMVEFASWFGGPAVYLFFAISGFVVSHSAQSLTAGQFVRARLIRIYLGYWLAVFLAVAAKTVIWHQVPTAEFSLQSLSLFPAGHIGYPLWIEWSLVFEVLFYLVVGLLWIPRKNSVLLAGVLAWLLLVAIAEKLHVGPGLERYGFFPSILLSLNVIPFLCGAIAYQAFRFGVRIHGLPIIFLCGNLIAWAHLSSTSLTKTIMLGVAMAIMVLMFASTAIKDQSQGFWQWQIRLGNASYGIYLLHTSVITISLALLPAGRPAVWVVLAVGMLAIAIASAFGELEARLHKYLTARASRKPALGFEKI